MATGGWQQFDMAAGQDGHYVVFDIDTARNRASGFLASYARGTVGGAMLCFDDKSPAFADECERDSPPRSPTRSARPASERCARNPLESARRTLSTVEWAVLAAAGSSPSSRIRDPTSRRFREENRARSASPADPPR
jgi:hypothetical protein